MGRFSHVKEGFLIKAIRFSSDFLFSLLCLLSFFDSSERVSLCLLWMISLEKTTQLCAVDRWNGVRYICWCILTYGFVRCHDFPC